MAQTPFTETEALLCIMRGDDEAAERLVLTMTPQERRDLARYAGRLRDAAARYAASEVPPIDDSTLWTS